MYLVEEGDLSLMVGLLLDPDAETFRFTKSSWPSPLVVELDETGTAAGPEQFPLQKEVNIPTVLPVFEDHQFLCEREVQEAKAVKRLTIPFGRNKRKGTANMREITMEVCIR